MGKSGNKRPAMALGTFRNITVTKKPDGLFQARGRIRLRTGVISHMARTATNEDAARNLLFAALQAKLAEVEESEYDGRTTFAEMAEKYLALAEEEGWASSTVYMYRHHLKETLIPELGGLAVNEITVVMLENMFKRLRTKKGKKYKPASLRNIRAPLSGVMGEAVRIGAIASNPVSAMRDIRGRADRAEALSDVQIELLLSWAKEDKLSHDHDLPDFIAFMLNTGCRIGEALALRWTNVDMAASQIHIRENIINLGKIEVRPGKTAAAVRTIYMSDGLFGIMFRRRQDLDLPDDAPVFASATGGFRSPHNMRRALRRLYAAHPAELGWIKQPTHVFRKTVATRMAGDSSVSDQQLADFLGHEDISTTQKSYIQRNKPSRTAAAALNGITSRWV